MNSEQAILLCKSLGDEKRMRIVVALSETKELCACKLLDIVECVQSTLSHHMKALVDSGLVIAREEGKWTHYSLDRKTMNELVSFLQCSVQKVEKTERNCCHE
ncbi:MAG TPA: metalloregulator ArsR/SmtB family transcription factor [Bacilli bacterium]|nr:metalloregulator ArsR/SmtB family transcription factor [Bacilli bacterium]